MFAFFKKDRFIHRAIDLVPKVILTILIVLFFSVILTVKPALAATPVCSVNRLLITADFSQTGGQSSNINLIEKVVQLNADPVGAGPQESNGEIGYRFSPTSNITARVQFSNIRAVGTLQGSSNIGFGSIRVDAVLRDLTDNVDLDSEEILNLREDGDIAETIIRPINTILDELPIPVFTEAFIGGHEYVALYRIEVRAQGFLGFSDFEGGNNGVFIGDISIKPELEDKDGDGLYDDWEIDGVDLDCDSQNGIDLDLPSMGANPNHKDLFLEIDWMPGAEPTKGTIKAVKDAFAAAPVDAGKEKNGGKSNPDMQPGINLWVDAGSLTDPSASEDSSGTDTCSDGLDNGGDGLSDSQDPDCLVGDLAFSSLIGGNNLGHGTPIPISDIANIGTDTDNDGVVQFYEVRQNNFSEERKFAFHYVISALRVGSLLGEAELGGNDVVVFKGNEAATCAPPEGQFPVGTNASTLMHELGHNLGLQHSGTPDSPNLKPNYVSVMNYSYKYGINQNQTTSGQDFNLDGIPDCRIIDYSPPRFLNGRGVAPLPFPKEVEEGLITTLDEMNINEILRLDPTDSYNQFSFYLEPEDQFVLRPLDQQTNWNGDDDGDTDDKGLIVDVNNDGSFDDLEGFHDWNNIVLDLQSFEDSDVKPINSLEAQTQIEENEEEILDIYKQQRTTDLEIKKTVISPFVVAGQEMVYRLSIINHGPNPAQYIEVVDYLPDSMSVVEADSQCVSGSGKTVTCTISDLANQQAITIDIKVRIAADLPCGSDQYTTLTNKASIISFAGYDRNERNNEIEEETRVLCIKYEYSAKFICGTQNADDDAPLGRAFYGTSINIHNPNDEKVHFFKKLALGFPPVEQRAGKIYPIAIDSLNYDEALEADCRDVKENVFKGQFPASMIEGFLVIQSPRSLDVSGVYTTTTPQTNIDVEQIRERVREQPAKITLPDLVVRLPRQTRVTCPSGQGSCIHTVVLEVENQSDVGIVNPFQIEVRSDNDLSTIVNIPSLSGGETQMLTTTLGPGNNCYNPNCEVRAVVDIFNIVDESDETNNEAQRIDQG